MSFKYLALLILFVLNLTATVLADSNHIDIDSCNPSQEIKAHQDHLSNDESTKNTDTHCQDHDCCHHNHVHYYLLPLMQITQKTHSIEYKFPEYFLSVSFLYSEVIKPPIV